MDIEATRLLLPEDDVEFLATKELNCDVIRVGNEVLVTLGDYELPDAYEPRTVALRVILGPGYPNGNPDMFWTKPWVKLKATGADPQACSTPTGYPDGTWQRWSRHYNEGWRVGVDGLRHYLAAVRRELNRRV